MTEFTLYIEVIKNVGFPGVIFCIWYIYHKSQVKTFEKLIEEQSKREERNFKLLKEMIEINECHSSLLSRIAEKLESNQWCPIIKKHSRGQTA